MFVAAHVFKGEEKLGVVLFELPIDAALAGETGAGVAENFSDVETLSAWRPLDILGTRWALIAEISTEGGLATIGVIRELSEVSIAQFVNWILISVDLALAGSGQNRLIRSQTSCRDFRP